MLHPHILTHLYSPIWASAQLVLSYIVSVLTCWDYCLKWGSVLPLSKAWHDVNTCFRDIPSHLFPWYTSSYWQWILLLQHSSCSKIESHCILWLLTILWVDLPSLNGNCTTVCNFQCPVVAGKTVCVYPLHSKIMVRWCYVIWVMVRWCYVIWVMVLTCVLKLPCTFN